MQELHDIRPPVMVGMDPSWITAAWIAGAIFLVALLLWVLLKKFWKKDSQETLSLTAPLQDPFASAINALDALKEKASSTRDAKKLYFALGEIMKTYIGKTHNTSAREMTTEELAASLKTVYLERHLATRIIRFQEECDPFRYAPDHTNIHTEISHRIYNDISQARQLIQAMEKDRLSHCAEDVPPLPLALPGERA